jgi:Rod binding domain-containing protein
MDKEALKAADPALHDHVSAHGGFGITEEMLKKLPPAQAEMIRGAGGITMGHLMQLMQTNSPLNSAAEVGKADYVKHSEGLAQLMMDNPSLRVDEKGGVTWPENMLQKSKDAAEEAKKEQLRKMVIYHTYGKQINSPFMLPTLALPGMTGGGN